MFAHIPSWNLQSPMSLFQLPLCLHFYFLQPSLVLSATVSIACACPNNFQLNWLHRNYFWQNFSTMQFHLWRLQFRAIAAAAPCSLFSFVVVWKSEWISWSIFLSFILSLKWNVILTLQVSKNEKRNRKKKTKNIHPNFRFVPLASVVNPSSAWLRNELHTHGGQESDVVVVVFPKNLFDCKRLEVDRDRHH